MQKYLAFDLYTRNEIGAHEPAFIVMRDPREVYLASEVDARIDEMRKAFEVSSSDEENKLRERVAELHKIVATLWNDVDPTDYEDIREAVMVELARSTG